MKNKIDLKGPVEDRQEKVTSYLHNELEEASIEEILKGLIDGNGMTEVVACLDMIAQEHKRSVILYSHVTGRVYPHPDVEPGKRPTYVIIPGNEKENIKPLIIPGETLMLRKDVEKYNGILDPTEGK